MIIVEQLDKRRTLTYSDKGVWIRQLETGNEYISAIDYVPHTYEETDREIEDEEISNEEALDILMGGAEDETE